MSIFTIIQEVWCFVCLRCLIGSEVFCQHIVSDQRNEHRCWSDQVIYSCPHRRELDNLEANDGGSILVQEFTLSVGGWFYYDRGQDCWRLKKVGLENRWIHSSIVGRFGVSSCFTRDICEGVKREAKIVVREEDDREQSICDSVIGQLKIQRGQFGGQHLNKVQGIINQLSVMKIVIEDKL